MMGFEDYCFLGYGGVWYPYGRFGGASCFHSRGRLASIDDFVSQKTELYQQHCENLKSHMGFVF
jgi:hypothetical protein